jgi:hypothetical protein
MGRIPPQPPCPPPMFSGNDYRPVPNRSHRLKFVGVIVGIAVFGYVLFCAIGFLARLQDTHRAEQVSALAAKGAVCTEETVYNGRGGRVFNKVTFEGHAYVLSAQRAFYHLESCPCKNVTAEKKP